MVNMKGKLAFCSLGSLGLIIEDELKEITYPDGTKGTAYVGIHLTDKIAAIGSPWCSRNPSVVGEIVLDPYLRGGRVLLKTVDGVTAYFRHTGRVASRIQPHFQHTGINFGQFCQYCGFPEANGHDPHCQWVRMAGQEVK